MNWHPMKTTPFREAHKQQVLSFLQKALKDVPWSLTLPSYGHGQETYCASSGDVNYFIKLGAAVERYQVMAGLGLAPEVIAAGRLEDGTSILVQPLINGRMPTRADFREHLPRFARALWRA